LAISLFRRITDSESVALEDALVYLIHSLEGVGPTRTARRIGLAYFPAHCPKNLFYFSPPSSRNSQTSLFPDCVPGGLLRAIKND
jgi:sorbitol-specific phosphotransferase system component IIC